MGGIGCKCDTEPAECPLRIPDCCSFANAGIENAQAGVLRILARHDFPLAFSRISPPRAVWPRVCNKNRQAGRNEKLGMPRGAEATAQGR